ncbi:hypothetical protein DPMN_166002 [Dreissena polymorpha]|uniref:Uncharacterized protein n=1 Tax=Dreissena polymorpha TaxID=45954 RepID=A0A9D4F0R2_DREPO|nr:hypothetical protein DPMN_166002 [Dreissena polymorpha]
MFLPCDPWPISLQKKSYRMLEEICAGRSIQSREFVRANLPDIQQALLKSLSTSSPSSKAKARAASYALLVEMGNSCIRWSGGETVVMVTDYGDGRLSWLPSDDRCHPASPHKDYVPV